MTIPIGKTFNSPGHSHYPLVDKYWGKDPCEIIKLDFIRRFNMFQQMNQTISKVSCHSSLDANTRKATSHIIPESLTVDSSTVTGMNSSRLGNKQT